MIMTTRASAQDSNPRSYPIHKRDTDAEGISHLATVSHKEQEQREIYRQTA